MQRKHWLLVEDNVAEAELAREALSHLEDLELSIATSGAEALERLRAGDASRASRPGLILLDLNLPGLTGIEVLAKLRAEQAWRHIPVIVLSSSDRAQDIAAVYAAGANCYL